MVAAQEGEGRGFESLPLPLVAAAAAGGAEEEGEKVGGFWGASAAADFAAEGACPEAGAPLLPPPAPVPVAAALSSRSAASRSFAA